MVIFFFFYHRSLSPQAGFEESRPINDVVNWHVIVRKYYELIGMDQESRQNEAINIDDTDETEGAAPPEPPTANQPPT